jgi:gluconokinase
MHAGVPLTDEDRAPWLQKLHDQIATWLHNGTSGILACSALKESYRKALIAGAPENSVRFVYLTGPVSLIRKRMEGRHGLFMPETLLPSQLATLDPPQNAIKVSIAQTIPAMAQQILSSLTQEGYAGKNETEHI